MYGCLVGLLEAQDPAALQLLPSQLLPALLQVLAPESSALDLTRALVLRALKGLAASASFQGVLQAGLEKISDEEARRTIERAIHS